MRTFLAAPNPSHVLRAYADSPDQLEISNKQPFQFHIKQAGLGHVQNPACTNPFEVSPDPI